MATVNWLRVGNSPFFVKVSTYSLRSECHKSFVEFLRILNVANTANADFHLIGSLFFDSFDTCRRIVDDFLKSKLDFWGAHSFPSCEMIKGCGFLFKNVV